MDKNATQQKVGKSQCEKIHFFDFAWKTLSCSSSLHKVLSTVSLSASCTSQSMVHTSTCLHHHVNHLSGFLSGFLVLSLVIFLLCADHFNLLQMSHLMFLSFLSYTSLHWAFIASRYSGSQGSFLFSGSTPIVFARFMWLLITWPLPVHWFSILPEDYICLFASP